MLIQTKYLGEIKITQDEIISFPYGLLGFENHQDFIILDVHGNSHFKFLQDINHSYLAFLIINPWDFFTGYEIDIPDENLAKIGIYPNEDGELEVYNIVTMGSSFSESTANLLAPIIVNPTDKKGKQFILNDSIYTTKHKLFPEGKGE